jgi:hypothetical protein
MAKAAEPPALLVVLTPFNDAEGNPYRKGDVIEPDHWAVRKWPQFFGPFVFPHPVKRSSAPRIEQATAAPGEKRGA